MRQFFCHCFTLPLNTLEKWLWKNDSGIFFCSTGTIWQCHFWSFIFSFPAKVSMLLSLFSQNAVSFISLPIPATWFLFLYHIVISYERYQTEFYNFRLVLTGNHFQGFQEDVLLLLFCNMNSWCHISLYESPWKVRIRFNTCVCPQIMYLPTNNV